MAESVQEYFTSFESRVDPSRTAGLTSTYVFDIDGAGQWTVAVDDGRVSVSDGASPDADCTLRSSAETFERIVAGELNPTSAYMTGKLKIKGDMGAALKLQKLL
jgi:putative sterol carrier protein